MFPPSIFFRKFILEYFEDPQNIVPCNECCDNCRKSLRAKTDTALYEDLDINGLFDYGKDANDLLQVIHLFNGHSGLTKPLAVLLGSRVQKIQKYHKHLLFGRGKYKSEEYWKLLSELLQRNDFLIMDTVASSHIKGSFAFPIVKLSAKANTWLHTNGTPTPSLLLKPPQQMMQFLRKKIIAPLYDTAIPNTSTMKQSTLVPNKPATAIELNAALFLCRCKLATQYNIMPYMVASNLALDQLSRWQPLNIDEMSKLHIDGFSVAKIIKFGPAFIMCIIQHKRLLPANVVQVNYFASK